MYSQPNKQIYKNEWMNEWTKYNFQTYNCYLFHLSFCYAMLTLYMHTHLLFLSVSCIEMNELQTMGNRPLKLTMYAWPLCLLTFKIVFLHELPSTVFSIIQSLVDFPPFSLSTFFPLLVLRAEPSTFHMPAMPATPALCYEDGSYPVSSYLPNPTSSSGSPLHF